MQCPIHQIEFKFVPPGVSKKTGKPYQGFYVCPMDGCEQRPPKAGTPTAKPFGAEVRPDWDKIGRMKALCGFINAMLSNGIKPGQISLPDLSALLKGVEDTASRFPERTIPKPPTETELATVEYEGEEIKVADIPF